MMNTYHYIYIYTIYVYCDQNIYSVQIYIYIFINKLIIRTHIVYMSCFRAIGELKGGYTNETTSLSVLHVSKTGT